MSVLEQKPDKKIQLRQRLNPAKWIHILRPASTEVQGIIEEPVDMSVASQDEYRPSEKEPFMNDGQKKYFRQKLVDWKEDILKESRETIQNLQEDTVNHPDLADRATTESEHTLELRTRDRQRKLISKIDEALRRIEEGTYGYCEETGDPISVRRLDARPIATLSIEAQERHERREKVYRDD